MRMPWLRLIAAVNAAAQMRMQSLNRLAVAAAAARISNQAAAAAVARNPETAHEHLAVDSVVLSTLTMRTLQQGMKTPTVILE